ncbi:MAG: calycin-like domain-containing protein [Bacteroidaceae bacterium]|nr:calycin-like domain-containing protein [Bacteroidaceae bacterium]
MKKFLLTIAVAMTTLFATAQTKTYTDNLTVSVNGETSAPQQTTINVDEKTDGTYTLSLNNFMLVDTESTIPVGNIVIHNIAAEEADGVKNFAVKQNINIVEGDIEADYWMGPMIGEVPVDMTGKMTDGSLYCTISIDLTENMGQVIDVVFGKDIKATRSYTDDLVVVIDGDSNAQPQTTINVDEKTDGTYTLSLNNFMLVDTESTIPVGNIVIHNIAADEADGVKNFAVKQNINIVKGDIEADYWMGPMLGEVPVDMTGKMTDYKLYCDINIDMTASLEQTINVKFGREDLSGIEDIAGEQGTKAIFDLTGRRVEAITAPGIYIVNGKKVIVK